MGMSVSNKRVIVATGFHNTRMSGLGRTLESLGCDIKYTGQDVDVLIYDAYGPTLYENERQNIEVLRLNEEMLEASGMHWWNAARPAQAMLDPKPFVSKFNGNKHILLMDPRICLLLQAYSKLNAVLVYLVPKDPVRVACELEAEWGLSAEHWLKLYKSYDAAFRRFNANHFEILDTDVNDRSLIEKTFSGVLAF